MEKSCENPRCGKPFETGRYTRKRYCNDRCCAEAFVLSSGRLVRRRQSEAERIETRTRYLAENRRWHQRQTDIEIVGVPSRSRPGGEKPQIINAHCPGSIAFALLYGSGQPFSRGDGREVRPLQHGAIR